MIQLGFPSRLPLVRLINLTFHLSYLLIFTLSLVVQSVLGQAWLEECVHRAGVLAAAPAGPGDPLGTSTPAALTLAWDARRLLLFNFCQRGRKPPSEFSF